MSFSLLLELHSEGREGEVQCLVAWSREQGKAEAELGLEAHILSHRKGATATQLWPVAATRDYVTRHPGFRVKMEI